MDKEINKYLAELNKIKIKDANELEKFRIKYISKKGIIPLLFSQLKNIPNNEKKEVGETEEKVGGLATKLLLVTFFNVPALASNNKILSELFAVSPSAVFPLITVGSKVDCLIIVAITIFILRW